MFDSRRLQTIFFSQSHFFFLFSFFNSSSVYPLLSSPHFFGCAEEGASVGLVSQRRGRIIVVPDSASSNSGAILERAVSPLQITSCRDRAELMVVRLFPLYTCLSHYSMKLKIRARPGGRWKVNRSKSAGGKAHFAISHVQEERDIGEGCGKLRRLDSLGLSRYCYPRSGTLEEWLDDWLDIACHPNFSWYICLP